MREMKKTHLFVSSINIKILLLSFSFYTMAKSSKKGKACTLRCRCGKEKVVCKLVKTGVYKKKKTSKSSKKHSKKVGTLGAYIKDARKSMRIAYGYAPNAKLTAELEKDAREEGRLNYDADKASGNLRRGYSR